MAQFGEMAKSNNVERKTRIAGWSQMLAKQYRAKYKRELKKYIYEEGVDGITCLTIPSRHKYIYEKHE